MGEPAQLGQKDVLNMRALAQLIYDGVNGDTADPHEVIMRFATDHDIPISTLLLQMAQFMIDADENARELEKILENHSSAHMYD